MKAIANFAREFAVGILAILLASIAFCARDFVNSGGKLSFVFLLLCCAAVVVQVVLTSWTAAMTQIREALEPKCSSSTCSPDVLTFKQQMLLRAVGSLSEHVMHGNIRGGAAQQAGESLRAAVEAMANLGPSITSPPPSSATSAGAKADQATEAELVAEGLTGPRVTAQDVQKLMQQLTYLYEQPVGTTSTFAHAFLGGFYISTGHSACVDPANFKPHLGMKYAREKAEMLAREKLWELEGYALFKQLNLENKPFA